MHSSVVKGGAISHFTGKDHPINKVRLIILFIFFCNNENDVSEAWQLFEDSWLRCGKFLIGNLM